MTVCHLTLPKHSKPLSDFEYRRILEKVAKGFCEKNVISSKGYRWRSMAREPGRRGLNAHPGRHTVPRPSCPGHGYGSDRCKKGGRGCFPKRFPSCTEGT